MPGSSDTLDVTFHRSAPDAFYVNSFLIHLPEGVAVVDTQFVLPEAEKLAAAVHGTGKPLLGVLLTHPHPDHVNGTGVLRRDWPGVPVYATRATADGIAQLAEPKRQQWKPLLGDAYPDDTVLPDRLLESGEVAEIGGVFFHFSDLGALESINQTLIALPDRRVLFAGDLFYNRVHPWLVEGRSVSWRNALHGMDADLTAFDRIYVGHGEPGDASSARDQVEYMDFVFDQVRRALADPAFSQDAFLDVITDAIRGRYPGWPLEALVAMNTAALLQELKERTDR